MLNWAQDKIRICRRIRAVRGPLKIVLKTKDDHALLPKWIDHHVGIVGPENLIVADNGSSDPRTAAIYVALDPRITLFHFDGSHNAIHSPASYPQFFDAINDSATRVLFIDTDEFLFEITDGNARCGPEILESLAASDLSYLTTYLYGAPGRADLLVVPATRAEFLTNCLWGKPILRATDRDASRSCNHNVQFRPEIFGPESFRGFMLAHLDRYSSEQRMTNNRNKLVARGLIGANTAFADIARLNLDGQSSAVRRWAAEVAALLDERVAPSHIDAEYHVLLSPDGMIGPYECSARQRLRDYLDMDPSIVLEALSAGYRQWHQTAS